MSRMRSGFAGTGESYGLAGVVVRLCGEPAGAIGVTKSRRRKHNASGMVVGVLTVTEKKASSPVSFRVREKVGMAVYAGSRRKADVHGMAEKCVREDSGTVWVAKKVDMVWSSSSLMVAPVRQSLPVNVPACLNYGLTEWHGR